MYTFILIIERVHIIYVYMYQSQPEEQLMASIFSQKKKVMASITKEFEGISTCQTKRWIWRGNFGFDSFQIRQLAKYICNPNHI